MPTVLPFSVFIPRAETAVEYIEELYDSERAVIGWECDLLEQFWNRFASPLESSTAAHQHYNQAPHGLQLCWSLIAVGRAYRAHQFRVAAEEREVAAIPRGYRGAGRKVHGKKFRAKRLPAPPPQPKKKA